MTNNFTDLVIELAVNPGMFTKFILDPDHVLDEAGLSNEEKAALKSRDSNRIREYVGEESGDNYNCIAIIEL